jgi:beta-fructofuranosidase
MIVGADGAWSKPPRCPFCVGKFQKIYTPGAGFGKGPWHINDHCFARGLNGDWHFFGIAWPDPGSGPVPPRGFLEHATAHRLNQKEWVRQEPVLSLLGSRGETVMWAPHLVWHEGLYYLYACTGGPNLQAWGITLATSKDL